MWGALQQIDSTGGTCRRACKEVDIGKDTGPPAQGVKVLKRVAPGLLLKCQISPEKRRNKLQLPQRKDSNIGANMSLAEAKGLAAKLP